MSLALGNLELRDETVPQPKAVGGQSRREVAKIPDLQNDFLELADLLQESRERLIPKKEVAEEAVVEVKKRRKKPKLVQSVTPAVAAAVAARSGDAAEDMK